MGAAQSGVRERWSLHSAWPPSHAEANAVSCSSSCSSPQFVERRFLARVAPTCTGATTAKSQISEPRTEKRKVGGSTPPLATVLDLGKQARSRADRVCSLGAVSVPMIGLHSRAVCVGSPGSGTRVSPCSFGWHTEVAGTIGRVNRSAQAAVSCLETTTSCIG